MRTVGFIAMLAAAPCRQLCGTQNQPSWPICILKCTMRKQLISLVNKIPMSQLTYHVVLMAWTLFAAGSKYEAWGVDYCCSTMRVLDMAVSRLQDLGYRWFTILKTVSLTHGQFYFQKLPICLLPDSRSRSQSGRSWTNPAGNFHKATIALQNILIRRLLYMLLGKKWISIISFDSDLYFLECVFEQLRLFYAWKRGIHWIIEQPMSSDACP